MRQAVVRTWPSELTLKISMVAGAMKGRERRTFVRRRETRAYQGLAWEGDINRLLAAFKNSPLVRVNSTEAVFRMIEEGR